MSRTTTTPVSVARSRFTPTLQATPEIRPVSSPDVSKTITSSVESQYSQITVANASPNSNPKNSSSQITRKQPDPGITLQKLRDSIPRHCFESSVFRSMRHVVQDLALLAILVSSTTLIPLLPSATLRFAAWVTYGVLAGFVGTGLWILAHECGHGGFSEYTLFNDFIGWTLHSFLLVPYFSWRSSHARHHRYTTHMDKDHAYVPLRKDEYAQSVGRTIPDLDELVEDAPIVSLYKLIIHQLFGFPTYLVNHITAGQQSRNTNKQPNFLGQSHFHPFSTVFQQREAFSILMSDLGLAIMISTLYHIASKIGWTQILVLYVMPYLWVNHWLVAITFLHHTHPSVPHYESETWTFLKGSLSTVDRDFGFVGRHFMHRIIENHVVHHLFPKIPFYHADEATQAIQKVLGSNYHHESGSFLKSLWTTFRECQWVEPESNTDSHKGVLYFRSLVSSN